MAKKNGNDKAIEVTLWDAANKLRGSVEPAEYKHVVLGLIFLKFADTDIQKVTSTYHQWQTASLPNMEGWGGAIPEFCYAASFDEVAKKDFSLVPSKYIEFVNRDENIDFDEKMKALQTEIGNLLKAEAQSKADLLTVFSTLGFKIDLS